MEAERTAHTVIRNGGKAVLGRSQTSVSSLATLTEICWVVDHLKHSRAPKRSFWNTRPLRIWYLRDQW